MIDHKTITRDIITTLFDVLGRIKLFIVTIIFFIRRIIYVDILNISPKFYYYDNRVSDDSIRYEPVLLETRKNWIKDVTILRKSYRYSKYNDYNKSVGFYILDYGHVYSEGAIPISKNNQIMISTYFDTRKSVSSLYLERSIRSLKKIAVSEELSTAIVLSNCYFPNYYHWILDTLSRLIFFKDSLSIQTPIILPNNSPIFVLESLLLLGYENILITNKNSNFRVKELYVPEFPSEIGNPRKEIVDFLRNKYNKLEKMTTLKTFISRKNAKTRRILNEYDFTHLLDKYNIITVYPEDMTFQEQVSVFQSSSLIVGVHGAGLTNLLFASSSCSVVEIFPSNYHEGCYENLSKLLGLDYYMITYKSNNKNNDIIIDLNEFENVLSILRF